MMSKQYKILSLVLGLFLFIFGIEIGMSWNTDWGLSIGETASLIIAVLALFTTIHQALTTRRHNRLQVQPLLMLAYLTQEKPTLDGTYSIKCIIKNIGLGPADITNFKFTFKNKAISSTELSNAFYEETNLGILYQNHLINCFVNVAHITDGIYLKEGDDIELFSIEFYAQRTKTDNRESNLSDLFTEIKALSIEKTRIQAKYSSIYKDIYKDIDSRKLTVPP